MRTNICAGVARKRDRSGLCSDAVGGQLNEANKRLKAHKAVIARKVTEQMQIVTVRLPVVLAS